MDQDTLFEQIPAFVLIVVMVLMDLIPQEYRFYLILTGIVVVLVFIFGTEYVFRITASKYLYGCITIRPTNQVLHAFITEPSGGIHCREIDSKLHIFETPLTLGQKLPNKGFSEVKQLVIEHEYPWEKRFQAFPGKAIFHGQSVDHSRCFRMTLWIPRTGQTVIDHAETIPIFWLQEGPGDYYLNSDSRFEDFPDPTETGTDIVPQDGKNGALITRYKERYEQLRTEKMNIERVAFTEHRKLIRIEGEFKQLKNEFRGALSRTRDVSKLVLEELLTVLSAHSEIEEAVNEYRKRPLFQITIGLAILILGIFGIYEYAYNKDFRQSISQNILVIIVVAVILIFVAMYLLGRRGRRR
jgi:hypothetical protein